MSLKGVAIGGSILIVVIIAIGGLLTLAVGDRTNAPHYVEYYIQNGTGDTLFTPMDDYTYSKSYCQRKTIGSTYYIVIPKGDSLLTGMSMERGGHREPIINENPMHSIRFLIKDSLITIPLTDSSKYNMVPFSLRYIRYLTRDDLKNDR